MSDDEVKNNNVISFPQQNKQMTVEEIAKGVPWNTKAAVVIMTLDNEGRQITYTSTDDEPLMMYLMEQFKFSLLSGNYDKD